MIRLFVLLSVLGLAAGLRAAERFPHLDDPDRQLPEDTPWAQGLEGKLASFERTARIRVLIRLQLKSPAAAEDQEPGAYMRSLAARLGVSRQGVALVYFADDADWRVWIGDELTPGFMGRAGTAGEFTASGAMHEAKEAFLQEALAQADATLAWLKSAAPKQGLPAGLKIALQADALVDGLIGRLAPK
jgi:hypothetical protein